MNKYVFVLIVCAVVFLVCFLIDSLLKLLFPKSRLEKSKQVVRPPRRSAVIPSSSVSRIWSASSPILPAMRDRFSAANPLSGVMRASRSFRPASTSSISRCRCSRLVSESGLGVECSRMIPDSISGYLRRNSSAT